MKAPECNLSSFSKHALGIELRNITLYAQEHWLCSDVMFASVSKLSICRTPVKNDRVCSELTYV